MKKTLLFAPAAYNLAETSRMIEIAKGIRRHPKANDTFEIQFISEGGKFEELIKKNGFPLTTIEPRITEEKIAHIVAVNDEEKLAPIYSKRELIEKVEIDLGYLKRIQPVAVVTGSYVSMPIACQVAEIPLVWTIQSTWLKSFFASGAGMTDDITPRFVKAIVDFVVFSMIRFWMWYGFIHGVNQAAAHFKVKRYRPVFDYFVGHLTLVAEPTDFATAELPPRHHFTGPLITNEDFPLPDEVRNSPKDKPVIYFAMGSSGLPWVVQNILESFEGKPYSVIAPVKSQVDEMDNPRIPSNVIITDWLPALEVNRMADLAVIHGGIGTVMTAALAGKPVVGVGMQPEQVANIACLVRKGTAIRVAKSKRVGTDVQAAIAELLHDPDAKKSAERLAGSVATWDGPANAAELLFREFGT